MSKKPREFQEYLITPKAIHVSQADYSKSPASAFLKYTVEAKDAVEYCKNKFPRDAKNQMTPDAQEALTHIISAFLPTVMGHFEAFQKYLFAGIFEATRFIPTHCCPVIIEFEYLKLLKNRCLNRQNVCRDFSISDFLIS